jgi:hypothetical protein
MGIKLDEQTKNVFADMFATSSFTAIAVVDDQRNEAEERRREFLLRRRGKFTSSDVMRLLASGASSISASIEGERGNWSVMINGIERYTAKTKESAANWLSAHKEVHGRTMLSTGAKTYAKEVFVERNTRMRDTDSFVSFAMQRGINKEKEAVAAFIAATGLVVSSIGDDQEFLLAEHDYAGGTPDGLIYPSLTQKKAIIEAKAPDSKTHYEYMQIRDAEILKEIEPGYYWQMQGNIRLFGDDCCGGWFISFDDDWDEPEDHLHYCWIERNQEDIDFMIMKENLAIEYVIAMQNEHDKRRNK